MSRAAGRYYRRTLKPRADVCGTCREERLFFQSFRGKRALLVCAVCGAEAPPLPSKLGNRPTVNPATGRGHQSKAEATFAGRLYQAREMGLIEDVRGLDRGNTQERFRLDVYSTKAVDALLEEAERCSCVPQLVRLCQDVRRSKTHVADYLSDFSWVPKDPSWGPVGEKQVADVKGWRNPQMSDAYRRFLMKKALVRAVFGIEVREFKGNGQELR